MLVWPKIVFQKKQGLFRSFWSCFLCSSRKASFCYFSTICFRICRLNSTRSFSCHFSFCHFSKKLNIHKHYYNPRLFQYSSLFGFNWLEWLSKSSWEYSLGPILQYNFSSFFINISFKLWIECRGSLTTVLILSNISRSKEIKAVKRGIKAFLGRVCELQVGSFQKRVVVSIPICLY